MNSSPTIKQHDQLGSSDPLAGSSIQLHDQPGLGNQVASDTPMSKLERVFQLLDNVVKTSYDFYIKDVFVVDDFEVQNKRGFRFKRTDFSTLALGAVYSVTRSDYCIGITSLSYAPTVGLPKPSDAGAGKTYLVKDEAGGAATTTITVRSAAEATIDGAATVTIVANYGSKMFYTDGKNWYVGSN